MTFYNIAWYHNDFQVIIKLYYNCTSSFIFLQYYFLKHISLRLLWVADRYIQLTVIWHSCDYEEITLHLAVELNWLSVTNLSLKMHI